jgi:hypothetical protein
MRFVNPRWLCVLALAVAAGCGSGDGTEPDDELAPGTIVGTIDGVDWITTTAIAIQPNGRLVATGNGTDNLAFGLGVSAQASGVYTTGGNGSVSGTLVDQNNTVWEAAGQGGSGTITITSFSSNEVSGTFSFNLVRTLGSSSPATRVVTRGRFRVRY